MIIFTECVVAGFSVVVLRIVFQAGVSHFRGSHVCCFFVVDGREVVVVAGFRVVVVVSLGVPLRVVVSFGIGFFVTVVAGLRVVVVVSLGVRLRVVVSL